MHRHALEEKIRDAEKLSALNLTIGARTAAAQARLPAPLEDS
jgi:hypothetical protein